MHAADDTACRDAGRYKRAAGRCHNPAGRHADRKKVVKMCRILARTKDMPREKWLLLRKNGIGGSDAGAICGVNPYANAMSVYMDKTGSGISGEEDKEAMRIGRDLEDYVAKRFMEATGLKARRANVMYQSGEHPFMISDVDRMIVGEDAGLECKTVSPYGADSWKDGNVPLHYVIQCLHYMMVTGKRYWYIAALIMGREFLYRRITFDETLAAQLVQIEQDFWMNNVRKKQIPTPDGTKIYDDILQKYFGASKRKDSIRLVGFDEKLKKRAEILEQIGSLEKEKKQIEQEVKLYMKDSELAESDHYRVSWSNVSTARLDAKRIREELPDVYKKYVKPTESRRFEVRVA